MNSPTLGLKKSSNCCRSFALQQDCPTRGNAAPASNPPPTGRFFEKLSHEESLEAVLRLAGYDALRAERDRLRARGV